MASAPSLPKPNAAVYQRTQVEHAIWRWTEEQLGAPDPGFLTRIRHLLTIDRSNPPARGGRYAFSEEPPSGQGDHALFSTLDAVFLYIGLRLQLAGRRREDAVFLARALRSSAVAERLTRIIEICRKAYPGIGAYDPTAAKNEVTLYIPLLDKDRGQIEPDPAWIAESMKICVGRAELIKAFDTIDTVMLIEIGKPAYALPGTLAAIPAVKRGRPSGK